MNNISEGLNLIGHSSSLQVLLKQSFESFNFSHVNPRSLHGHLPHTAGSSLHKYQLIVGSPSQSCRAIGPNEPPQAVEGLQLACGGLGPPEDTAHRCPAPIEPATLTKYVDIPTSSTSSIHGLSCGSTTKSTPYSSRHCLET